MRIMSFALTTDQVLERTKTQTRRAAYAMEKRAEMREVKS